MEKKSEGESSEIAPLKKNGKTRLFSISRNRCYFRVLSTDYSREKEGKILMEIYLSIRKIYHLDSATLLAILESFILKCNTFSRNEINHLKACSVDDRFVQVSKYRYVLTLYFVVQGSKSRAAQLTTALASYVHETSRHSRATTPRSRIVGD